MNGQTVTNDWIPTNLSRKEMAGTTCSFANIYVLNENNNHIIKQK